MVTMVTRRRLDDGDFEAWLTRFEQGAGARKAAGCRGVRRFRGIDDPQELFVVFEWDDLETARAFVGGKMGSNPKLSDHRENGDPKMENIFCEELSPLDN